MTTESVVSSRPPRRQRSPPHQDPEQIAQQEERFRPDSRSRARHLAIMLFTGRPVAILVPHSPWRNWPSQVLYFLGQRPIQSQGLAGCATSHERLGGVGAQEETCGSPGASRNQERT